MNSPVAYFTVYILGVQLVSAAYPNGSAASVTNTQQPNSSETWALPSAPPATGSASAPGSPGSGLTSGQSALFNGTHDGSNLTTTSLGSFNATEGGDGNTTVETSSPNNATRKPATSQPKGEDTPAVTTEGKATATAKSSSTTVAKTAKPTPVGNVGSGYVLLVLLILVIICFLVVIYFLHKKSKRYSFDLHHKVGEEASIPLNTVDQEGSFQPTGAKEADDLAQPVEEENIPNSITVGLTPNGPSSEPEPGSDHDEGSLEKAPSEDSFGSQAPLSPKDEPFTLDLNDLNLNPSTHTSVESLGEPNNENNNAGSGDTPGKDSAQADLNQDVAETHLDETA